MPVIPAKDKNILPIVVHPDQRLYTQSEKVGEVTDEIRKLFDQILECCKYHDNAVGLAGTQVGIMKHLFVSDIDYFLKNFPDASISDPSIRGYYCFADAEVIEASPEMNTQDESCMSLPGVRVPIDRPKWIKFKFKNYNNEEKVAEATGYLVANIMHEIDHCNGITLFNHMSYLKKSMQLKKLEKELAKYQVKY